MKRCIETDQYFKHLRERMTKHDIASVALAAEIGCGPDQLSRWLSGALDPKLSSIVRIEAAMDKLGAS